MLFPFILPIFSAALDMTYLNFSPKTNPTSRQVNMTVTTYPADVSYGVELWFRPVVSQGSTGSFQILGITNDWTAYYITDEQAVSVQSQSNFEYCRMAGITANQWTHLAFTFDISKSRTFTCYKNNSISVSLPSAPTVSKSPDIVRIGGSYTGNYLDLRVWSDYAPTLYDMSRNQSNYLVPPYHPSLKKYYRMILGTSNATFQDFISLATVSVSSFYFNNLWMKESPGSLILCPPGSYTLNSACSVCPSTCKFCLNAGASSCFATSRSFVNLQKLQNTTSLKLAYPAGILTIELWFYPFAWSTNLEIFSVGGLIKIKQRGADPIVSFYDGSNNEVFNFTATPGKWVHVAWVSQLNNRADLYVNSSSVNVVWASKTIDPFFYIGSNNTSRFNGYVADIRMWTSRKTSIDILSNQLTNYSTKPSDLQTYCPLNDTTGKIDCRSTYLALPTLSSILDNIDCTTENCVFWCPPRYFYSQNTGECAPCDSSCLSCSGPFPDNCTVCSVTSLKIAGLNDCYTSCPVGYVNQGGMCQTSCSPGYYNSSNTCMACSNNCTNCLNSTYCTGCPIGYTLYSTLPLNNCLPMCNTSQFANASKGYACENCSSNCSSCYGTSLNCTSCGPNLFLYNSVCISNCSGSKYLNGSNCFDCDPSCSSCASSGKICLSCSSSFPYSDQSGVCYQTCPLYYNDTSKICLSACPVGSYPMDNKKCDFCDESCIACNGPSADNCTACPNFIYKDTCLSSCPNSTFDVNNSICVDCDPNCTTCNALFNNCTSCSGNNSYYYASYCYPSCPPDTFNLELYKTCYDTCPKGYFVNDSNCSSCDFSCSSCVNNSTQCTSCPIDKVLFNSSCVPDCPDGFYQVDSVCEPCDSTCLTCSDLEFCTSCANSSLYLDPYTGTCNVTCNTTTYILNSTCVSSCPRNYYPSSSPNHCQTCPAGCLDCTSNSTCQTCKENYYFMEASCLSACPNTSYYADNSTMICKRCDVNCLQCVGSSLSNCTLCTNGRFVYVNSSGIGNCVNSCPDGTYQSSGICLNCLGSCNTCNSGNSCTSCLSGNYFRSDKTCAKTCLPGDLVNSLKLTCVSYSSISPLGQIDLASFSLIQITYPISVSKGVGNLTIFSIDANQVYTFVKTYYISFGNTVALGNSIATSVSSSLFEYGKNYTVEYSEGAVMSSFGSNLIISRGIWNFYIKPYTLEPLFVVINNGTRGVQVRKGDTLRLDATRSYDPSSGYYQSVLQQNWSCYDFTTSYTQYSRSTGTSFADYISSVSPSDPTQGLCSFWNYQSPPTSNLLTLNNFSDLGKVFRFTFTLSDQSNRTMTKDIFSIVVPSNFYQIDISNLPIYKIDTGKDLQLSINNPQFTNNSAYKWTCISSGSVPLYQTPLDSWILSISANSLSPNTNYMFSVTYSDLSTKSSVVISFQTNSPPNSGTLSLDRSSGLALIDTFTIQMIGWLDDDLPLSYSFIMSANYSTSYYFLTPIQSSPVLSSSFAGGVLNIKGYCYDSLGSRNSANTTITVESVRDIQKIIESFDGLSNTVDESNVFEVLSNIQGFSAELNYSYELTTVYDMKASLFNLLLACKKSADNSYANGETSSVFVYPSIVGASKDLLLSPVNADIANNVISLIADIDFTRIDFKPVVYPSGNSSISAVSTQGLFRRDEINSISTSLSRLIVLASSCPGNINNQKIATLVSTLGNILAVGTVVTQTSVTSKIADLSVYSTKSLVVNLENSLISLNPGVSVQVSGNLSSALNTSQIAFFATIVNSNPFLDSSTTVLNQYIKAEVRDVNSGKVYQISGLDSPFIFTFNVSRETLQQVRAQASSKFNSKKVLPLCSYWNEKSRSWEGQGCSLYNIAEIYSYFDYQNIPNTFSVICSCNHLSQFSVNFYSTQEVITNSYIIDSENTRKFSLHQWETSVVFYLLVSGLAVFFVLMSVAFYWDNYNPGLKIPSIETEKALSYWDPNRVETVLSELQRDFLNQLSGHRQSDKKDTVASVAQILNSGLVNKLVYRSKKDKKEERELARIRNFPHPVEVLMKDNPDEEAIQARLKRHLKKGTNDPRFIPSIVGETKAKQNSKKDLENTKSQLKQHLSHLESNSQIKTPVDLFLDQYDDSLKLPPALKAKLKLDKKALKIKDFQALGLRTDDFKALSVYKDGEIAADYTKLTGGKYSEKIIEDAKRLHGSLKLPYWSLFCLYVKKEHKYLSIVFNLHIEYTKKQMIVLASIFWYQQLLFCLIYVTYINLQWGKYYNQSGFCVWGCNYESELLAGSVCAMIPWPLFYLCKYLFSRNVVEEAGLLSLKVQAHQNKLCRETIGVLLSFSVTLACVIGIIIIIIKEPFSVGRAERFCYCYLASMVWSLFIGEIIGTAFKAWLVWMASSNKSDDHQSEPGVWSKFAKETLIHFPCMLPTEL